MMTTDLTYSQALASLELVVNELEDGALPLELLPQKIQEANNLLTLCDQKLRHINAATAAAMTATTKVAEP